MVTVKQLKGQIRKHNRKQCIRLTQRKAGLISSLDSVKGGSAPAPAPGPAQQQQQQKKKTRVSLQTTPFGAGGPSASAFGTGGGSSSSKSSKKKKKKSSGFLPSNSEGQQSFNKKMKTLKKKSKKGKGKDAAPDLAFGGAYSDAYGDV